MQSPALSHSDAELYSAKNTISPQALPELATQVYATRQQTAEAARFDPVTFNSFVLKDEETGGPIEAQPMHEEWQGLITAHKRTLIWAHVEAGKSQQISVGRSLFELGRNRQLRICIISNTVKQAGKILESIGKYIESDDELHAVYPDLKPDKASGWNKSALNVMGRLGAPKDPSVQATGIHGNILGSRIDLLIIDDLLDYESALSAYQREELWNWFQATLEGRLTRKSKVICVGTAWHREDIMHRWARLKQYWTAVRYPIVNSKGALTWPERWPEDRIEEKKGILGPTEFARQCMCVARNNEDATFDASWIDLCRDKGRGRSLTRYLNHIPEGYRIYTGVDLSSGKHQHKGDLTAMVTIAVAPNEDRHILGIEAGRWQGPEIVRRINSIYERYQGIIIVENNGVQEWMLQFVRDESAVPVIPFNTGKNKINPEHGISSLAIEMANGKWVIPTNSDTGRSDPEVEALVNEILAYDPSPKAHTGDRLMAMWFAREGSRIKRPKGQVVHLNTLAR